jgi:hypothetical protein
MTDRSPNLDMPYLLPSQAQKHVSHNEALQQLDALVQFSVTALDATTPPPSPAPGERYGLGSGATGDWAGHDGEIALRVETGWIFLTPQDGWRVWDQASAAFKLFQGSNWDDLSFAQLGINTSADATNRLALKSDAALFSHDDVTPGSGDIRVVLNKSSPGQTGSLTFQTSFSGRAELGLTGDDNAHFKVSSDGSAWHSVYLADRTNGYLGIGDMVPAAPLHLSRSDGATKLKVEEVSTTATARTVAEFINNGRPDVVFANASSGNEWSMGAGSNLVFKSGPIGSLPSGKTNQLTLNGTSGNLVISGAAVVASYTVATLPSPATAGAIIYVSDETGGAVTAFADGTNWRRTTDRAVVS